MATLKMEGQSQNIPKKTFCEYCNKYYQPSYYKEHFQTKMHEENVSKCIKNAEVEIVTKENITPFDMPEEFYAKYNISKEGDFKVSTSVKFKKQGEYSEIDVTRFDEIMKQYYNHFKTPFKFYLGITAVFYKQIFETFADDIIEDELLKFEYMSYTSSTIIVINLEGDKIGGKIEEAVSELNNRIEEGAMRGSGWIFKRIEDITLNIHQYKTPVGGTYIPLPFKSNVILNIQNENDNKCFVWSILAYLHPIPNGRHGYRVNKYKPFLNELNLDGIEFPINLDGIKKFHKQNKIDFNVFTFTYNEQTQEKLITPLFRSHLEPKGCNLFQYENHFVLCKNAGVFLSNYNHHPSHPCLNCCSSFRYEHVLKAHQEQCVHHQAAWATFSKNEYAHFRNYQWKNKEPFTIYADFESWNKVTEDGKKIQAAFCFGIYVKSYYPQLIESFYIDYYGEDCVDRFVQTIKALNITFQKIFKECNYSIDMSTEDEIEFQNATTCHYCNISLETKN